MKTNDDDEDSGLSNQNLKHLIRLDANVGRLFLDVKRLQSRNHDRLCKLEASVNGIETNIPEKTLDEIIYYLQEKRRLNGSK